MANTKITNPELFNLGDSTSATQLPVMTTTQRIAMNAVPTFNIDYLVVAGGGGGAGGFGNGNGTGAGGAGGLLTTSTYGGAESVFVGSTGVSYDLIVGSSGAGGIGSSGSSALDSNRGLNGGNSKFNTVESIGGGGGGANNTSYLSGASGGSGGGGAPYSNSGGSGTINQGNSGGAGSSNPGSINRYRGGGGGGASQAGVSGDISGNGGDGIAYASASSITGLAASYAGGGGGGVYSTGVTAGTGGLGGGGNGARTTGNGASGLVNTGGGGGGAGGDANYDGGTGGSGIVILRYTTADVASYTATGLTPTETTVGTDTILSFTTVGTGTITFTSSTPTGTISTGEMIFNSTTDKVEYWDGTKWYGITYESTGESPYNNVIWPGNGSSSRSNTGLGFQPDLVWVKARQAQNHTLYDSIRGTGKFLASDTTNSENSNTTYGQLTSFDADGFTGSLGSNGTYSFFNSSSQTYVAWCFKAGGAAVANTDGSTASQVSANVNGGFSIVKTAPTAGAITFGHGLDSAPEMIINKGYASNGWSWLVYHKDIGTGKYLMLNSSASTNNFAGSFSNVTSTTITNASSTSSQTYVNYCFHSVPGYSKVGSYTGNGNSTGTIVTLDFAPSFVMIKGTDQTSDWIMIDNKRDTTNPNSARLDANSANAEYNGEDIMNLNSNGFQLKTSSASKNGLNKVFIYMAFA